MTDGCKIIFLEVSQPAEGVEGILFPPQLTHLMLNRLTGTLNVVVHTLKRELKAPLR